MELLKQKTLIVGICSLVDEEAENEQITMPGYFFDVNGVPCGLVFSFWSDGTWRLVDRLFGVTFGVYETFEEAADAVHDGAWVREEHDKLLKENPDMAAVESSAELGEEAFRTDNPLKGRPGITLIPESSTDSIQDYFENSSEDLDDDWDDSDWDDDDWDTDEEEVQSETVSASAQIPEAGVSSAQIVADEDDDDEDWDIVEEDDAFDDWDDLDDQEDALDDEWLDDSDDEDDDVWDDDDFDDDEEDGVATLVPRAAYIVDVARNPIAVFPTLVAGAIAWWEAFDVMTGTPLWTSQSLSELMRVAPLFLVFARSIPTPSMDTKKYLNGIALAFDGSTRQKPMDYLSTGYIKATGREYLDMMNQMFMDPLSLENAWSIAPDDSDDK